MPKIINKIINNAATSRLLAGILKHLSLPDREGKVTTHL